DFDMSAPEGEDVEGAEGEMDLGDMAAAEGGEAGGEAAPAGGNEGGGQETLQEVFVRKMDKTLKENRETLLKENAEKARRYNKLLEKRRKERMERNTGLNEPVPLYDKTFLVNEELDNMSKLLDKWLSAAKKQKEIRD
ncbi:MAG: hypothetical protein J6X18_16180, partial [Bacteroidales bacterium]|nr:hypothetical protein [Bacteroidales bacterium]